MSSNENSKLTKKGIENTGNKFISRNETKTGTRNYRYPNQSDKVSIFDIDIKGGIASGDFKYYVKTILESIRVSCKGKISGVLPSSKLP